MANQWLRLWHDMPNDPKWRTIARASKQPISTVIAVYVHLLVIASNATERGRTHDFCSEDVASALDVDASVVDEIITAMSGRVIDEEGILSGWSKRQVEREDGSAQRARAWREAKKLDEQTQPNATERNRTPDKDTEEIKKLTTKVVSAAKPVSRKTRMPENFGISERVKTWAGEKGFDRLDEHLESFLSKAKAAGYRYVDWDEALMNAIRDNWAKLGAINAPQRVKFQSSDWMRDDIALERKAGELGVRAYPGEDYAALRQRVIARTRIQ
jgi:hypothetical protein